MANEFLSKIRENFSHYLVLAVILNIGLAGFICFQYVRAVQFWVVFLTGVAYVIWGIIHHYLEGDLHLRVVLEYLATAIFGFLIIWFLLLRA